MFVCSLTALFCCLIFVMIIFEVVVVLFGCEENCGIFEAMIALFGCKESCGIFFSFLFCF